MKIAYFTPVSPQRSGISDYSEREMLPYISKYMDIDIFVDDNVTPTNKYITNNFNIYNFNDYSKKKNQYDLPIYQMGNNLMHEFIYNTLVANPGITILHDIYLHGFLGAISLARGNGERYINEFRYCYGEEGENIAKEAIDTLKYPEFEYPLAKRIIDNSLGIVCYSEFGIKRLMGECSNMNIFKMNQPFTIPPELSLLNGVNRDIIRNRLNIRNRGPIIASFGYIFPHKRYHVILKAFRRFIRNYPNAALFLVGQDSMGINTLISELGLSNHVFVTGYLPYDRIMNYLEISDFCINLRYPTAGETSRSILEIMAARKPVIVSNIGWFSEIPNNCCLKLNIDMYEEDILVEYMRQLSSNESLRDFLGKNAQAYIHKRHNPEKIAIIFNNYIKNVLNCNEYILSILSGEMSNVYIDEESDGLFKYMHSRYSDLLS